MDGGLSWQSSCSSRSRAQSGVCGDRGISDREVLLAAVWHSVAGFQQTPVAGALTPQNLSIRVAIRGPGPGCSPVSERSAMGCDEAGFIGEHNCLRAIAQAQFREDARDVCLHGGFG